MQSHSITASAPRADLIPTIEQWLTQLQKHPSVRRGDPTAILIDQAQHLGGDFDVWSGWQLMEGEAI